MKKPIPVLCLLALLAGCGGGQGDVDRNASEVGDWNSSELVDRNASEVDDRNVSEVDDLNGSVQVVDETTMENSPEKMAELSLSKVYGPDTEVAFHLDLSVLWKSEIVDELMLWFPEIKELYAVDVKDLNMTEDDWEKFNEITDQFTEATGIALEDFAKVSGSFSGFKGLFESLVRSPQDEFSMGPDAAFLLASRLSLQSTERLKGFWEMIKLFWIILKITDDPEIEEFDKLLSDFHGATLLSVPHEWLDLEEGDLPFTLSFGLQAIGKDVFYAFGRTSEVKRFFTIEETLAVDNALVITEMSSSLPEGSRFWVLLLLPEAPLDSLLEYFAGPFLDLVYREELEKGSPAEDMPAPEEIRKMMTELAPRAIHGMLSISPILSLGFEKFFNKSRGFGFWGHLDDESIGWGGIMNFDDTSTALQASVLLDTYKRIVLNKAGDFSRQDFMDSNVNVRLLQELIQIFERQTSIVKENSVINGIILSIEDLSVFRDLIIEVIKKESVD